MTGLELTAERRTELAELLGNPQRLRRMYPKLAEYLDMAPQLRGTDDPDADAAFDLRVVHYTTGADSVTRNPYWDVVAPSVSEVNGRRVVNGGQLSGSARLAYAETILQDIFAYAVPSPETIEWIRQFADGRKVLELGAGRGYWSSRLFHAVVHIAAFDSNPPGTGNTSFSRAPIRDEWFPVWDLARFKEEPLAEAVLFLCWPPGWGDPMASNALRAFEEAGGGRLIYVGEPKGGRTGDDALFDRLDAAWTLKSVDAQHVSWWNLGDVAQAWVRA
ncbi:hypothetical protein [Nocardia sp. XZ_19_385]|uniref:hypothetical protein n=1 Tax=Nocardia sp. XZ_19_385 TaxID=2769488 RepID=UPI00188E0C2F|nr:hypothetical protein [Nocardia sp. XZ_19_385]